MFWFEDLTAADPFYLLPILTSAILWVSAELGVADGMQGQPPETISRIKWGMRALAVILVPITVSMPAVSHSLLSVQNMSRTSLVPPVRACLIQAPGTNLLCMSLVSVFASKSAGGHSQLPLASYECCNP